MNNTIYDFVRHCIEDKEFNAGGIPTKEEDFIKSLKIKKGDLKRFYAALGALLILNRKYNKQA